MEIFKYNYTFGNSHNNMKLFHQLEIFKDNNTFDNSNNKLKLFRQGEIFKDNYTFGNVTTRSFKERCSFCLGLRTRPQVLITQWLPAKRVAFVDMMCFTKVTFCTHNELRPLENYISVTTSFLKCSSSSINHVLPSI